MGCARFTHASNPVRATQETADLIPPVFDAVAPPFGSSGYLPAKIISTPGVMAGDSARTWQGVPTIARAPGGRLWAAWYTGGLHEGADGNYVAIATSANNGEHWSKPVTIVLNPVENSKLVDPIAWLDPLGRLWIFYLQTISQAGGNGSAFWGTAAVRNDRPDEPDSPWTGPYRIGAGSRVVGPPLVLPGGEWAVAMVTHRHGWKGSISDNDARETCLYTSTDEGKTWRWFGGTAVPPDLFNFSEHSVVPLSDGRLWMVMRTKAGLHQSFSSDGGRRWTDPELFWEGPHTRLFAKRLTSGSLMLVYHDVERPPDGGKFPRSRMAVWLSDDDGKSWPHKLLIDDRRGVSYPEGIQAPDGRIFIIYDRWRYGAPDHDPLPEHGKAVLLATIREEDIRAGKLVSPDARLHQVVNIARGYGNIQELRANEKIREEEMRENINRKLMEE